MISKEHEERINRDASRLPASAAAEGFRACYAYGAINERYIADKEIAKLTEALSVAREAMDKIVGISITTLEREPSFNQQSEIAREALAKIDEREGKR